MSGAVSDAAKKFEPTSLPSLTPPSVPVPGAVPSPEVAEAQKATLSVEPTSASESALPQRIESPVLMYPDEATADVAAAPREIGMQHMELVYQPTLQCRMCL